MEAHGLEIRSKEIELVPINLLVPYEKNMHKHSDEQIERLCHLIRYQGFRDPLIVQKGTNIIGAGHGRFMAAKKLGMEKVPVVYQEFESEEQFYAFVVSHNAIGKDSWAQLDLSQINVDLEQLGPELEIDMLGLKNFTIEPMDSFIETINRGDENSEWAKLEGSEESNIFEPGEGYTTIVFHFKSESDRSDYAEENNLDISLKKSNQWIIYK